MNRFLRFAGLGIFSVLFSTGGTAFLSEVLGASPVAAYATVLSLLIAINYLACRYLIFPSQSRPMGEQAAQFLVSALCFRGMEYLGFLALYSFLGVPYIVAIVTVQGLSFLAKFAFFDNTIFSAPDRP